jgi:uncharacterized protein (DUF2141 family)
LPETRIKFPQLLVKFQSWANAVLWVLLIFCISCATPSSPTGGPRDEEGPSIVRTEPETGTTNFDKRSITLHFSEFVERSTLQQAIVVEPDIGISYGLDWGRKSVEIEFDRAIPDSTTLIITVGTDFTDTNGNEMSKPYKVAVSTGPEIDEGKLYGRVINAQSGDGREGQRVLLYRDPFDLSEKANYIASTDTSGTFEFSYLSEGKYKVFWVDDRNRNKIWEQEQERAQSFGREYIELDKAEEDTIGTVYTTAVDTTNPTLQGIGLFSSQRMRIRFSENMQLTDSVAITVMDTLDNTYGGAVPLYIQPNDAFILFAHSEESLSESSSYGLEIEGIADESGNELEEITQTFTGSSQEDTTQQRIIKRNNLSGYYPTDPIEITYAKPIEGRTIRDSLKIVEGDSLIEDWPNVEVHNNVFRILPKERWKDGTKYEVRTWDPQIEDYRKFQPELWHESQMGSLNVMLEDSTMENVYLRIANEESEIVRDTMFSEQIEITNLPPLRYKIIAYHDQNTNGSWNYGTVSPFTKPEPYFIQKQVPVERELTGDLTISFQE